ncbi:TetR/AcrR family transcriptional regulator [Verminephrobacter eiseniae]|uniref:TetR/AcrR family transcriptional regulator n=1 Tax=Verminephrobacter eiseniae TaxID=364317 RepID=UPI002237299D|nr:TetR/AcrR family transcriptional regulator [Verminephrobacter eiseniae]MCW5233812.1 TetR/AcrR family transcriptional regulator [Verminephrobacter eiseniae]MCW5261936.1 TetR/AcrR family transcriptional regulator [Verminephrobacter eiseniae]
MAQRGRPLSFDRQAALERAMDVFWRKGFEGAQLVDLTMAMGISPPSFYAAFGSKKEAFYEAVELYIRVVGSKSAKALNGAASVRDGLRSMLEATVGTATSNPSGGCLLVLGAVNHLPENEEVWTYLKKTRTDTLAMIRARIQRGVDEGELPSETDVGVLAQYFLGITQSISFQARDGASRASLKRLIAPALAALPQGRPAGQQTGTSAQTAAAPGLARP